MCLVPVGAGPGIHLERHRQVRRRAHQADEAIPDLVDFGAYAAWPWGVSRLIDGLELVRVPLLNKDSTDMTEADHRLIARTAEAMSEADRLERLRAAFVDASRTDALGEHIATAGPGVETQVHWNQNRERLAALGLGLSATIPGRNPALDGFGLIAFASLFPMITVMGYAQLAEWWSHRRLVRSQKRTEP